jgi:hypothetical protein
MEPQQRKTNAFKSIFFAVVLQLFLVGIASLILDGGATAAKVGYAALAYWLHIFLLVLRPGKTYSRSELILIRMGIFLYLPIVVGILYAAERLIEY